MTTRTAGAHVLVIGAGSVGRRHARNLAALGCAVRAADPRQDRLAELTAEVSALGRVTAVDVDVDAALAAATTVDAVVIASPTAMHPDQAALALAAGVPVLVEKPLAATLAAARTLAAADGAAERLLLGYTWRWWPALGRVRELVQDGAIGRPLGLRCVLAAHLADWHPWERYQDFFMASRELGGGALLDESHWIDLALWLLGPVADVSADVARISDLDIETDDNVELVLRHVDGARANLHLDLHGRPHERSVTVVGTGGTLRWSDAPDEVALGRGDTWTREPFGSERNDMFVAVARDLLALVEGARPRCGIDEGLRVLEVVEAARISSAEGRRIAIGEVGG